MHFSIISRVNLKPNLVLTYVRLTVLHRTQLISPVEATMQKDYLGVAHEFLLEWMRWLDDCGEGSAGNPSLQVKDFV